MLVFSQNVQLTSSQKSQQRKYVLYALTVLDVLLPVEEPVRDLVLAGVLHDRHDLLDLFLAQLAGALSQVDVGLLQHNVGVAATDALSVVNG